MLHDKTQRVKRVSVGYYLGFIWYNQEKGNHKLPLLGEVLWSSREAPRGVLDKTRSINPT